MSLLTEQQRFARMVPRLIDKAHELGFDVTLGDAYRDSRCAYGSPKSLHRMRLAIDLNLFRNGEWLHTTEAHQPLGEWWESIGGAWGGRFGESRPGAGNGYDGNHYSLEHNGLR